MPSSPLLIYILLSIKTRIETLRRLASSFVLVLFISYYPLKQGLKHAAILAAINEGQIYILLSIKTRIETRFLKISLRHITAIYILLSIKTRIETETKPFPDSRSAVIYILLSIKTRIETWKDRSGLSRAAHLYPTIH